MFAGTEMKFRLGLNCLHLTVLNSPSFSDLDFLFPKITRTGPRGYQWLRKHSLYTQPGLAVGLLSTQWARLSLNRTTGRWGASTSTPPVPHPVCPVCQQVLSVVALDSPRLPPVARCRSSLSCTPTGSPHKSKGDFPKT